MLGIPARDLKPLSNWQGLLRAMASMCYTGPEHARTEGQQERVLRYWAGLSYPGGWHAIGLQVHMQGKLWQPVGLQVTQELHQHQHQLQSSRC